MESVDETVASKLEEVVVVRDNLHGEVPVTRRLLSRRLLSRRRCVLATAAAQEARRRDRFSWQVAVLCQKS